LGGECSGDAELNVDGGGAFVGLLRLLRASNEGSMWSALYVYCSMAMDERVVQSLLEIQKIS